MQRHVDDAVSKGAQVLLRGKRLPGVGSVFAPTVLSDVPAGALVNKGETFGPVAALTRFETEEEMIRLANDSPVGLAGYFFSRGAWRRRSRLGWWVRVRVREERERDLDEAANRR